MYDNKGRVLYINESHPEMSAGLKLAEARARSMPRTISKRCAVCDATNGVRRCSGCFCYYYCGEEHQKQHWAEMNHRHQCKLLHEELKYQCRFCNETLNYALVGCTPINDNLKLICCDVCLKTNFREVFEPKLGATMMLPLNPRAANIVFSEPQPDYDEIREMAARNAQRGHVGVDPILRYTADAAATVEADRQ